MLEELEVLRIVSERLESARLPFMLTGSFAMAYYGKPRMTRDLDIVVSLQEDDVNGIVAMLSPDFYIAPIACDPPSSHSGCSISCT